MHVHTSLEPATVRYAHHMGSTTYVPTIASAWFRGGHRVEITSEQYPGLDEAQLVEKAIAILRAQTKARR